MTDRSFVRRANPSNVLWLLQTPSKNTGCWEFRHIKFQRGKPELLEEISLEKKTAVKKEKAAPRSKNSSSPRTTTNSTNSSAAVTVKKEAGKLSSTQLDDISSVRTEVSLHPTGISPI